MKIFTAAEIKPELSLDRVQVVYFVSFLFSVMNIGFDDLRLTTNTHSLFAFGLEWLPAGTLLEIKLPEEDASLEVHAAEIALDGLDPAVISLALNVRIEGTPVIIHIACYDADTNQLVGNVWPFCRGTIGEVRIVPPSVTTQI